MRSFGGLRKKSSVEGLIQQPQRRKGQSFVALCVVGLDDLAGGGENKKVGKWRPVGVSEFLAG